MTATLWFIVFGGVFILTGLAASAVRRLPITTSLLYLGVGVALGPHVLKLFHLTPVENSAVLERVTELVVIISLFTAGLKLRLSWEKAEWRLAFRLAFLSMTVTVALIALVGVYLLKLPLGAAVLLGAILAPTDPVLASDVQVKNPDDQDRLRFGLTGEAGLNDGTAFPFVMLGLGLLGLHDIGEFGTRWILVDLLWAVAGGLMIGAGLGTGFSHLVIHLRKRHRETVILDDFLALGLIALSYGFALLLKSYGFLAVFAAGLAIRRTERLMSGEKASAEVKGTAAMGKESETLADTPEKIPAYTAQAVLLFNEQLERIGEVGMVVLLGAMIWVSPAALDDYWFIPVLFLVIRPLAVAVGLWGSPVTASQKKLIAWFGIRGIGSMYYLMYAIQHDLPRDLSERLSSLTLGVIAASILVHGLSVTPFMKLYTRKLVRSEKMRSGAT